MQVNKINMLEVLQFNKGFICPERWIEYGIAHQFKKTKANKIDQCPDCNAGTFVFIGQFVYYSTLVNLLECVHCGLIFTDTRIDPNVISTHFDQAYKDEEYFIYRRCRIFEQIARIVDKVAPQGGRILDIGGAKGHMLATLKTRRPDLNFVLNDLSKDACDHVESKYGFETILGGVEELEQISCRFEVVVLSDVIYYEPELRRLWSVLPQLVSENGTIIIRVPNKIAFIRSWQFMKRTISRRADIEMQDSIRFLNPEHLFVFSRRYLFMRLKSIGFHHVLATPSELLVKDQGDLLRPLLYYSFKIFSMISFNKIIFTPSLLVLAKK